MLIKNDDLVDRINDEFLRVSRCGFIRTRVLLIVSVCVDVRGPYIADASLFSISIMANPQFTEYALASYIADQIIISPTT